MAQVLATTPLDPEQRELVSAMVFSADVLLAIISDVLDLSKVEAGTSFYNTLKGIGRRRVFFYYRNSARYFKCKLYMFKIQTLQHCGFFYEFSHFGDILFISLQLLRV